MKLECVLKAYLFLNLGLLDLNGASLRNVYANYETDWRALLLELSQDCEVSETQPLLDFDPEQFDIAGSLRSLPDDRALPSHETGKHALFKPLSYPNS